MEDSESMERIGLPAARIAGLSIWIVENAVSLELALRVELSLIACAVAK